MAKRTQYISVYLISDIVVLPGEALDKWDKCYFAIYGDLLVMCHTDEQNRRLPGSIRFLFQG